MIKTVLPIKGMHCKACEILITEKLAEIKNISKVKISCKHNSAEIYSRDPLNLDQVKAAVEQAGYHLGVESTKPWFSRNWTDYMDLALALLIVSVLYVIASGLGLFNFNVASGNPGSLLVVLLIGLTAGVSTCMALIGGLVLSISANYNEKNPEHTVAQKFQPQLFFNLGRVIGYFVLGGLIGLMGMAFQLSTPVLGFVTILVGLVMLFLGLRILNIFPKLSAWSFTLPASLSKLFGINKSTRQVYSHWRSAVLGALTFFLPCGFTQAVQLYAISTGNFMGGALIMSVFALGTTPGLLGIGGLSAFIKGSAANFFFKVTGLIVIFLALFNIGNGYNLTGWTLDLGNADVQNGAGAKTVELENGVQVARMKQTFNGYSPTQFVVKKDIPVKWVIDSEELNSCAASIAVPALGISKPLKLGENVIEFVPEKVGKIKFTCMMGMFPGEFIVVDEVQSDTSVTADAAMVFNTLNQTETQ